jgi:C-terminal processing protease CtpA/Prc
VGSTSAGADGNVSTIPLPGGLRAAISGLGVFYPDGSPTQRVGIRIDIEVHPTVGGIRAARDEILESAIHQIVPELPASEIEKLARPDRTGTQLGQ